jgi:hypothetical protein
MLGEISRFNKRNRQNDQIIFSYSQTTRITRKGKQLTGFVIIKDFYTDSKINYRGFPLYDVLIPAKIEMDCQLLNKFNKVLAAYNISDADFNSSKNQFTFNYTDTNNLQELKFVVKQKQFMYTNRNKSDFNNKLSDIDRYYDVIAKMSMAFDDLSRINPNNIELLFEYENMIRNIYRLIDEIESYHLEQNLNLRNYDPQLLNRNLDDLKFETNRQRDIVNHSISILYQLYYNRGLEAMVNGNEPLAVSLFEKSLYNNPLFAPSQLQLARIDYKNNRLDEAADNVKDIFYLMKPDPETGQYALDLSNDIYLSYLQKGEVLLNQGAYQVALEVFQQTRNFCRSIPGLYCTEQLSANISKSINGIYMSYVDNARYYLNNGDLSSAEANVRKAMDYFKANQSVIQSNAAAIAVLTDIKSIEYSRLIAQGKVQLKSKNYDGAFKTLQDAENMEGQYNITKSNELRALLTQAAKPVILADLTHGFELVRQNKIREAKEIVVSAYNIQNKYNLTGDNDIIKQMEALRKKIFTQECINAQNEFDLHLGNARNNILNKAYLDADKNFESALRVADNNPNCMIERSEALNLKKEVQSAIDFMKMQNAIDEDVKMNRFSNAVQKYIEIQKYFEQRQIARNFGLNLLPMVDYVALQQNGFVMFVVNFYISEKSYENALKLLDVLKSRSLPSRDVKNEQLSLGTQLAIRDHAANASQDYKVTVLQYSRSDKWYKNLAKAYAKQWKNFK